ncbi:dicarboxylate/amino acid:cation symporter [Zarconia navalis]|uniref:dicarboxylate/amino acid:cation symporter n=1 Tax=Zarconia navalis TaxID=2992134 RepID=UPI0021F8B513|nr:dicarboxylate/amino acid:cation symporter [Zarconia navalis]
MNQPSNKFLIQILVGIALGLLLGGFLPSAGNGIAFIGELFIRALLMLVVPLVVTSMVVGMTSLGDVRQIGRLGGKTIFYYLTTTAIAVIIGLALVTLLQPGYAETEAQRIALRGGEQLDVPYQIENNTLTLTEGSFARTYDDRYTDFSLDSASGVRGTIDPSRGQSSNRLSVEAWTDGRGIPVIPPESGIGVRVDLGLAARLEGKDRSIWEVLQEVAIGLVPRNLFASMANNEVLPLIVISIIFGGVLTTMGSRGRLLMRSFEALNEAIMAMVNLLMLAAPVGIGALIAGRLGAAGGFVGFLPELIRVSKYTGTVILALAIHGCIILPIILYIFGKQSVKPYAAGMAPALTTAFSTSSSSATLPVTMECVTEKNFISERTASFVLPLGATINMDGTALYEAVAAVFIAQIYGIELSFVQMTIVFLTSTLAAIGAAGIPEAGLVTMAIVLRAVDLPIEGISLILIVDWFLDRCRTTVNVWGDAIGAAVVDWTAKKD